MSLNPDARQWPTEGASGCVLTALWRCAAFVLSARAQPYFLFIVVRFSTAKCQYDCVTTSWLLRYWTYNCFKTLRKLSHCSGRNTFLAVFLDDSEHPGHSCVSLGERGNNVLLAYCSWLLKAHIRIVPHFGSRIVFLGRLGGLKSSSVCKCSLNWSACRHFSGVR